MTTTDWWRMVKPCQALVVPPSAMFLYGLNVFVDGSSRAISLYTAAFVGHSVMLFMSF